MAGGGQGRPYAAPTGLALRAASHGGTLAAQDRSKPGTRQYATPISCSSPWGWRGRVRPGPGATSYQGQGLGHYLHEAGPLGTPPAATRRAVCDHGAYAGVTMLGIPRGRADRQRSEQAQRPFVINHREYGIESKGQSPSATPYSRSPTASCSARGAKTYADDVSVLTNGPRVRRTICVITSKNGVNNYRATSSNKICKQYNIHICEIAK